MSATMIEVGVDQIQLPAVKLREVNREDIEFQQLCRSIKNEGVLLPILIRPLPNVATPNGEQMYGLIDGLQRFTASKDNGFDTVPARVMEADEYQTHTKQFIANFQRVRTKPVAFGQHIMRMSMMCPEKTSSQIAEELGCSEDYLNKATGLQTLTPEIGVMVDNGEISLANSIALSKLPAEEQADFLEQAQTLASAEFVQLVKARSVELKAAEKQGRKPKSAEFEPVARALSKKELLAELETRQSMSAVLDALGANSAAEGFVAGLQFAVSLDPISVNAAKAKFDDRQAEREAAKAKAKAEKDALKEERAHDKLDPLDASQYAPV